MNSLFGYKKENVLTPGVLTCFDKVKYFKRLDRLAKEEPVLHNWVNKRGRKDRLFDHHSMLNKTKGGFFGQYLTTNVAECMNNILKGVIPNRCSSYQVVTRTREYVTDVLKECDKALFKDSTAVYGVSTLVRNIVEREVAMDDDTKQKLRKLFGLPITPSVSKNCEKLLPLLAGLSRSKTESLCRQTSQFSVAQVENQFFVKHITENIATVFDFKSLHCKQNSCSDYLKASGICPHLGAILLVLKDVDFTSMCKRITDVLTSKSMSRAMFAKAEDGGKSRKGNDRSKSNVVRVTNQISKKGRFDTPEEASKEVDDRTPIKNTTSSVEHPTTTPKCKRNLFNNELFSPEL